MKIFDIYSSGISGVEIRLNLADLMVLSHTIERIQAEIDKRNAREAWDSAYWDCPRESREEWKAKNPAPECSRIPEEEYKNLFTFCKKLILKDGSKPTIFDEDEPEHGCIE